MSEWTGLMWGFAPVPTDTSSTNSEDVGGVVPPKEGHQHSDACYGIQDDRRIGPLCGFAESREDCPDCNENCDAEEHRFHGGT